MKHACCSLLSSTETELHLKIERAKGAEKASFKHRQVTDLDVTDLGFSQRKTEGQQLKGKIVSALFHTFWQFSTHFHTFSEFFRIFPPRLFLRIKGFYCCFGSKIRKENKREKKEKDQTILHVSCCTFVLL